VESHQVNPGNLTRHQVLAEEKGGPRKKNKRELVLLVSGILGTKCEEKSGGSKVFEWVRAQSVNSMIHKIK